MAERFPVPFPFAGRADSTARSAQPLLTTLSARNVRGRDARSGRIRGASRSGLSKFNGTVLGAGRVKALASTAIDSRTVEYDFTVGQEELEWTRPTTVSQPCYAGVVDRQGNIYAIDSNAGIVKYNSAGRLVMKLVLPTADPGHIVRAIDIGDDDRIYAAVSAGGDVRTARMWCVVQLADDEYHVLWTFEPGAYTEDLRSYRGTQLYAAHNYPTERRSRVIAYENIGSDPTEALRIEGVPYPINGMDQAEDGAIYTASPPVTPTVAASDQRPSHPSLGSETLATPPLVGWDFSDLLDHGTRIWSRYDPTKIEAADVEDALLEQGAQILRLRDLSGNNRDFFAGSAALAGETGPTYAPVGINGLPSIDFRNDSTHKQSLVTPGNSSIDAGLASQQRTAIPTYIGSQFCLFIVVRASKTSDAVTPSPRVIMAQENEHATASDHVLFANRNCKAAPLPGTVDPGWFSYYAVTDNTGDAGACAGPTPQAEGYEFWPAMQVDNPAHVITILWDGGVDPNDSGASRTRCMFRVDGAPVDRFEGLPLESLQPTWLGLAPTTIFMTGVDVARRFNGQLGEIVCLVRKDFTGTTEPKVVEFDAVETVGAAQTNNEMTRIEARLAYVWGCPLGLNHPFTQDVSGSPLFYIGPPKAGTGAVFAAHRDILASDGVLAKYDSQGTLIWAVGASTTGSTADTIGGIGYGVAVRKTADDGIVQVYSIGPDSSINPAGTGNVAVRKVIDEGQLVSTDPADGAWVHRFASNAAFGYAYPKPDTDKFGNLYVPGFDSAGPGTIHMLYVLARVGSSGNAVQLSEFIYAASADLAHAVAVPPDELTPDYRGDLATELAEMAYVFTDAGAGDLNSVQKVRLVTVSALATGSPHEIVTLAAVDDDLKVVTSSSITVPTGGSAAIDSSSQFVQILRAGDDLCILDGTRYLAYSLRDGTISALESTTSGEIPPRAQLAMFWRHRLVVGRFADAPGHYAASRLGNIRDWDMRISETTAVQAFRGVLTRAGEAEDAIVAMIPASDDLAFLLGDTKILRLTGDPQDGGQIHLVSDSVGGTFGNSWCKDPQGRVFFFGNPPGLYLMRFPEGPQPLSEQTLAHSEFRDIDFSTHRIMLAWNPIDFGVHIWQVAWSTNAIVNHWFYEEGTREISQMSPVWTDRLYDEDKQPTAVCYLGGDDTRALLVGCADGFIRVWDKDAVTDDGDPIYSFFVSGPLNRRGGPGRASRLLGVQVALASDQGPARLELFGSEAADDIGPVRAGYDLRQGENPECRKRVRGNHLFLRVSNARASSWALESMAVEIEDAGRQVRKAT